MGKSYYVATNGSDSNPGTSASPFATILQCDSVMKPGDTCYVTPGTYSGGFITYASGTSGHPVSFVSTIKYGAIINGNKGGDIGWQSNGSYVVVTGFTITGATNRVGYYGANGSYQVFSGNSVHDILTDPSAYSRAISSGNGGAGAEMDDYRTRYGDGGQNGSITGNVVYNIGRPGKTDSLAHGIYFVQRGAVSNNIVYNVSGCGFNDWHGGSHEAVMNNTIDGARGCGMVFGADIGQGLTADYNVVGNNIVANSGAGIVEQGSVGSHNAYYNNLIFNSGSRTVSTRNGAKAVRTITADPNFVNRSGHDYHLQSGSPAISAGSVANAPTIDFDGNHRLQGAGSGIGAYEHGTAFTPSAATSAP